MTIKKKRKGSDAPLEPPTPLVRKKVGALEEVKSLAGTWAGEKKKILDGSVAPIASNRTPNPPSEF